MVRGGRSLEKDLGITAGPKASMGHGLWKSKGVRTGALAIMHLNSLKSLMQARPSFSTMFSFTPYCKKEKDDWQECKITTKQSAL